jgi:FMN phosphatase YigB (HAD superfamily)
LEQRNLKIIALPATISALVFDIDLTNNPTSIGCRTLQALGVERFFPIVIGLDTIAEPKPTMIPFRIVSQTYDVPLTEMVSIGDRFAIDIQLPVEHGMGSILVQGVEEVCGLPSVLLPDDVPWALLQMDERAGIVL